MADNLTAEQNKNIQGFKDAYAKAQAAGDKAGMEAAHAGAESIRKQAGFSGGVDGSQYVPLSGADKAQGQEHADAIRGFKQQYAEAQARGDQAGMQNAHQMAENLRKKYGYSGGADGSQNLYGSNPIGGMTAEEMAKWNEEYEKANTSWNPQGGYMGYANGYSVDMNLRSQANKIRQQMERNSQAWATADPETRKWLHDQNVELEKVLRKANGGAQSYFNDKLGRWETDSGNLGYGTIRYYEQPDHIAWAKDFYGMTDDQIEKYKNDTDRYHNFVDQSIIRNWVDDSSGYTGNYAQFVNGPYGVLMGGAWNAPRSTYIDVQGDGFGGESYVRPPIGPDGKVIPQLPLLKNNQGDGMDYTRQHAGYVQDGVIMPNTLNHPGKGDSFYSKDYDPGYVPHYDVSIDNIPEDQIFRGSADGGNDPGGLFKPDHPWMHDGVPDVGSGGYGSLGGPGGGGGASIGGSFSGGGAPSGGLQDMLNGMYDAALKGQLSKLEQAYKENQSNLSQEDLKINDAYREQQRQAAGQADLQSANFRETANANGLNSGTYGQSAIANANQLQSELNALGTAQAQAQADLERRRTLMGQEFQAAILEAQANNDAQRLEALYKEAVRQDQLLREEARFQAQMAMQQRQQMMSLLGKVKGVNFSAGAQGLANPYGTPYTGGPGTGTDTDEVDSPTNNRNGHPMSDLNFNAFMHSTRGQFESGRADQAIGTVQNYLNNGSFTPSQQRQMDALLKQYMR